MASEMKIEIPTQLITDTIRAELVRQIGADQKEKFVEAIVKQAMEKKRDSYSSTPTYFEETVNNMIREEAVTIFRQWLETNRAMIAKALFTHLNQNKQKRLTEFAENIAKNICAYGINVNLNLKEKD